MDSRDGAQHEMCDKMNKRYENKKKRKEGQWSTEIVQKETTRIIERKMRKRWMDVEKT